MGRTRRGRWLLVVVSIVGALGLLGTSTSAAGPIGDTGPQLTVENPEPGDEVGFEIFVRGTATDDSGIAEVRVAARHEPTGLWLVAPYELGRLRTYFPTHVADPPDSNWQIQEPLNTHAGDYTVYVEAIANDGGVTRAAVPVVNTTDYDCEDCSLPPTLLRVLSPADGDVVKGPFKVGGEVYRAVQGVPGVAVAIRDDATGQWYVRPGLFSDKVRFHKALVDNSGEVPFRFKSISEFKLRPGTYSVWAWAIAPTGSQSPIVSTGFTAS